MTALAANQTEPSWLNDAELIAKYDGRAPRYTSYPTAAQFTPAVNAETYEGWLRTLAPNEALSLYIHVPFCQRLCWYCGCNTRAVNRPEIVNDYVTYLRQELALLEAALPERMRVTHVHLGGGTPNMLSRDNLTELFGTLRHIFRITGDIAAELDPAVLTESWVKAAAFHGLTRASLGVQDLSPEVQKAVNRIEPYEVLERAVGWLRAAGVRSINFDLMYGLPKQTARGIIQTLDKVLALRPDRIALFGYAHVPWMKPHQGLIDVSDMPGPAERLDQARAAADRLIAEGYVAIGLDHFALPEDELAKAAAAGALRRNFQGYTTDQAQTLIGVGASAIGHLPQGYVQNQTAEVPWRKALDEERLPVARGVAFTGEDEFRGEIIERLMCNLSADLPAICARHGRELSALTYERRGLEDLVRDGLVSDEEGVLTISERGRPFVRALCAVFDTHLEAGAQRHSRVV